MLRALQRLGYSDTPLLKGILAPVDKEIFQENLQVVEGTLPKELNGALVRTGPNDPFKPWGGYHLYASCYHFSANQRVHSFCGFLVHAHKVSHSMAVPAARQGGNLLVLPFI